MRLAAQSSTLLRSTGLLRTCGRRLQHTLTLKQGSSVGCLRAPALSRPALAVAATAPVRTLLVAALREPMPTIASDASTSARLAATTNAATAVAESLPPPQRSLRRWLRRVLFCLTRAGYLLLSLGPLLLTLPLSRWPATSDFWWRWAVRTAESSGALIMKLCQWASSRPDIIGQQVCARLVHLQDNSPPHAWSATEATLRAAFGAGWSERLRLERAPVGVGCIAQVYRGELLSTSGRREEAWTPVAVKVMHPGVHDIVAADMDLLRLAARMLDVLPGMKWLNPKGMVEDFAALLTDQLDLRIEARNLARFNANFRPESKAFASTEAARPLVLFPVPFLDEGWCTHADVLVETFIEGEPLLTWAAKQPRHGDDPYIDTARHRLCNRGIDAFLQMMLEDNFVHGDLHPGNMLVTPQGELCFVDAGIAISYPQADHTLLVDVLAAFIAYDGRAAARHMCEAADERAQQSDPDGFAEKIHDMVLMARDSPTFFDRVGECFAIICNGARDHRVKLKSGFVSIAIGVKTVEGAAIAIDPMAVVAPRAKPAIVAAHAKRLGRAMLGGGASSTPSPADAHEKAAQAAHREQELEAQEGARRRAIEATTRARAAAERRGGG